MTQTIKVSMDRDGVATIILDRPDKHNAINGQMISELSEAALQLGEDPALRAVILTGNGPSFCAGGDLEWMRDQQQVDRAGKIAEAGRLSAMLAALNALPVPLVARVHGSVYGGGVGLLAVSDIAIATRDATLALTETRLGLIPATIGPFVLARIGQGMARQVFFTGSTIPADLALRSGLLHEICEADALDGRIARQIGAILKTEAGAVAAAKRLCLSMGADQTTDVERSIAALADCWESPAAQERIRAFLA